MVLVDTSVWSLALRRRRGDLHAEEQRLVREWEDLVRSGTAVLVGPIRQEVLSGIRSPEAFANLQEALGSFGYLEIVPLDYDEAAQLFNRLRSKGITSTPIDLLICVVARRHDIPIFSTDPDFTYIAPHAGLRLHQTLEP